MKTALDQQIAKARELTEYFRADAQVTRSDKADYFHLTLNNLAEEHVREIADFIHDSVENDLPRYAAGVAQ